MKNNISYTILFVPGGPGLSGVAESKLISPIARSLGIEWVSWNSPSRLKPNSEPYQDQTAFRDWIFSLDRAFVKLRAATSGPLIVVGHSFGCIGALALARRYPSEIQRLGLVTPSFRQYPTHKNIAGLALRDFRGSDPEKAARMDKLLAATQVNYDPAMREALALAFEDPELLQNYWRDPAQLQVWLDCLSPPEYIIDFDLFHSVSLDLSRHPDVHDLEAPVIIPTYVAWGERDPVIHPVSERQLVRRSFIRLEERTFPGTAHFVQLEATAEWLRWLSQSAG